MTVTRRASAITANRMQGDDLFADLDHAHRRRGCLSCRNLGCFFLLLIFICIVGVFGIIAETGIVRIPFLSAALYNTPPPPIRIVEPTGQSSIEALLREKSATLTAAVTSQQPQVSISEQELTQLVREPRANGQVPVKQGQVTIEPTFVELYGLITLPNASDSVVIRIRLLPAAQPDSLRLGDIRLGYVRVPTSIAKAIVRLATGIAVPDTISGAQFGIRGMILDRGSAMIQVDKEKLPSTLTEKTVKP
jgi:hypothetical protein